MDELWMSRQSAFPHASGRISAGELSNSSAESVRVKTSVICGLRPKMSAAWRLFVAEKRVSRAFSACRRGSLVKGAR
jgi:hypothetical protein